MKIFLWKWSSGNGPLENGPLENVVESLISACCIGCRLFQQQGRRTPVQFTAWPAACTRCGRPRWRGFCGRPCGPRPWRHGLPNPRPGSTRTRRGPCIGTTSATRWDSRWSFGLTRKIPASMAASPAKASVKHRTCPNATSLGHGQAWTMAERWWRLAVAACRSSHRRPSCCW